MYTPHLYVRVFPWHNGLIFCATPYKPLRDWHKFWYEMIQFWIELPDGNKVLLYISIVTSSAFQVFILQLKSPNNISLFSPSMLPMARWSCSNCRIFCSFYWQSRLPISNHSFHSFAVGNVRHIHRSCIRTCVTEFGTDFNTVVSYLLKTSQDVSPASADGDIRHFGRAQLTHFLFLTRWKSWKNSQRKRDNRKNQP